MKSDRNHNALPPGSIALMQRAVKAHEQADPEQAEADYLELTQRHPDFPDAWHFLGLLYHDRGDRRPALECLHRAQTLDPDNLFFLLNFGRILREQGNFTHALELMRRAYQLYPEQRPALAGLAESLLALGRGDELIPDLERRVGEEGADWGLWYMLGRCRDQGGDRIGALDALSRSTSLAPPDEPAPWLYRAECARRSNRNDLARQDFQQALAIAPNAASAYSGLAELEAAEGHFEACERLARQALAVDPNHFFAWTLIAETRANRLDAEFAQELEEAARRAGSDRNASVLHFARGKSWEKLGEYDRAFQAYDRANREASQIRRYVPQMHIEHARNLMENVNDSFLERHAALGNRPASGIPTPIFICGMPRSGTTLLETILGSHTQVRPAGEMRYIHDRLRRIVGSHRLGQTGTWLGQADTETLMDLALGWDQALAAEARGLPFVTDKLPGNYNMLGLIHACYPRAPVIYVKRDERDNCFSCFSIFFKEGNYFSYTQESLAHYYRLHEALVEHWRDLLGSGRIIDIRYEDLVREPESTLQRLFRSIGIPWEPHCLEFHKTRRTVMTASVHQVRQPMYDTSIGRWRHFERHLGPLLEGLRADPPL